ncbi:hypothetical protein BDZ45DRAFT_698914 [Acephala macrosclerotiorum]|nr:hypothetical protein BDZ45DRAFT_698914 [Acephala macrosclerotiorum]
MSNHPQDRQPRRRFISSRHTTIFGDLVSLIRGNDLLDTGSSNTSLSRLSGAPPALRRVTVDSRRVGQRVINRPPPHVEPQYIFSEEFRAAMLPDPIPDAMDVDVASLQAVWGQPAEAVPQPMEGLLQYLQAQQLAQAVEPAQKDAEMAGLLTGPAPNQNDTNSGRPSAGSSKSMPNMQINRTATLPQSNYTSLKKELQAVPQFKSTSLNKALMELVAENVRKNPNAKTKNLF